MKVFITLIFILILAFDKDWVFAQTSEKSVTREFVLPSEVDKVVWAGRGDVLLLQMNNLKSVVVFDIKTEKILGNIPFGGQDSLVGGTAESIILVARDKKVMQHWSIAPLAKINAMPQPIEVQAIVCEYYSLDPICLEAKFGAHYFDAISLNKINLNTSILKKDNTRMRLKLNSAANDSFIFTGNGGVYRGYFQQLNSVRSEDSIIIIPTIHPEFYIQIPGFDFKNKNKGKIPISLYFGQQQVLLKTFEEVPGLGKINLKDYAFGPNLTLFDRIIAHPSLKKLIVIDESRKLLHIQDFDPIKLLDEQEIKYLFVDSFPITSAFPEKKYEYAIKVISKVGKVTFTIDSAPSGMTISADGLLSWNVPKNLSTDSSNIVIAIEDASKQKILHSFTIYNLGVQDKPNK